MAKAKKTEFLVIRKNFDNVKITKSIKQAYSLYQNSKING